MRLLVAVDLDQTVVYSRRSAGECGATVVVEHLDGEPLSAMTEGAVAAYETLAARHCVVPVTTRTVAQYERIALPAPAPRAVCANGGVLLVDGSRDAEWTVWVTGVCAASAPLADVQERLRGVEGADWVRTVRAAEGLFCYVVAHSRELVPTGWLAELTAELHPLGWGVSVQGRKVYAVPAGLSKAAAGERLAGLLGAEVLLAAGDSLLDRPLLELAVASGGAAVRPAHGELHELGWDGAQVTAARGARAGEELLRWLLARAGELSGTGVPGVPAASGAAEHLRAQRSDVREGLAHAEGRAREVVAQLSGLRRPNSEARATRQPS